MNPTTTKLATLLGTASLMTMANANVGYAQMTAQAEAPGETVLITGSLIRGTVAVGVPVTNLSPMDFAQTGALTTSDLFRTFPAANVSPGPVATESGANIERGTRVNLRQLDTGNASRSLLMVDGVRFPGQGNGLCAIDPSIIPQISLDRIDILVDGASATYGADAVGGVINVVLRRNFDGAITQLRYGTQSGGKNKYAASQLWGRTWDGGGVTIGYEWYDESHSHGNFASNFTTDFSPWGLDNRIPLASSLPGTISTGTPDKATSNVLPATLGTNCTNCYAIPQGTGSNWSGTAGGGIGFGPTSPYSASTLNWSSGANPLSINSSQIGSNGTRNEFNPYLLAYGDADNTRNGATITIDQRLTKDISFFGTGFYSNRRAHFVNPSNISPAQNNDLSAIAVPTWNPYYPTGGAPSGLRVSYNLGLESPSVTNAYELAMRYQFGLNIALPYDWNAQVFYAQTYDSNTSLVSHTANKNAVSAALGWTIASAAPAGTAPGIATWKKPATIPYLNLFCDPFAYQCNSRDTLDYIGSGINSRHEVMQINTKTVKFDGPIMDLPAGQLKAAVGATYETTHFSFTQVDSTGSPSLLAPYLIDAKRRAVWAVFTQVNIPVFSDMNALPLLNRVDLEASWRHDQYSDFGGTSNPKVGFNWMPSEELGLTIRGGWGTSFRAPSYGELSLLTNTAIACQNPQSSSGTSISGDCNNLIQTAAPGTVVGSGAWKVSTLNGGIFGTTAAPFGISHNGGSAAPVLAGLRASGTINAGSDVLKPEKATNWSIGGEFAPQFLPGLDLQATWYRVKITDVLQSFGNPTTDSFNDPLKGFAFLVPSDFGCPISSNAAPSSCAAFQAASLALLSNPRSAIDPAYSTLVYWINDGGSFNKGWLAVEGIDFNGSYDWDMGDIGAFNVGLVGTYYLSQETQNFPGTPIVDTLYNVTINNSNVSMVGVESRPRFKYRARVGWANGPYSVTAFMDYQSHFFHTQTSPPNVNNQCLTAGSSVPGGTFASLPCAITGYTNLEPSFYSFDLSLGYDTGDDPANDYLKNIGIQFVIQNIMGRRSPFEYRVSSGGGNPAAFDILKSDMGRTFNLILTKTW